MPRWEQGLVGLNRPGERFRALPGEDAQAHVSDCAGTPDKMDLSTYRRCDIECASGDCASFPNPDNPRDHCYMISAVVWSSDMEDEPLLKVVVTMGPCQKEESESGQIHSGPGTGYEDYELVVVDTEQEVLESFAELIVEWNVSLITGWNIM